MTPNPSLDEARVLPIVITALLILIGLFGGLLVHLWIASMRLWSDFWHAIALTTKLERPWRVAWSRARRRHQ